MKDPTAEPGSPSLGGLLEEATDAIPVRITIVQDDVTTGWDDGALGFEGDAVWSSGRATSFRLMAPDILPGAYLLSRREAVTRGEALNQGFPLRHPTREVWVRVKVLTEEKKGKALDEARLIEGDRRLRALSEGDGVSEYPPLAPRPGLVPPERKRVGRADAFFRKHRLLLSGVGGTAFVVGNHLTVALHGLLGPALSGVGMGIILAALGREDSSTSSERKTLRRIAQEEDALVAPVSP